MTGLKRPDRKRKRRWDACDCSGCDFCDFCDCNLGMFQLFRLSTLLLAVASVAPARRWRADRIGVAAIGGYQRWVSPRLTARCRHTPSCSGYGAIAISRYGLREGLRLTASRLRRCTAEVPSGTADPVP